MKNISLENFNPKSSKEPVLTTPRSIEACRRQGILPKELIMRSFDEIKEMYGDGKVDREGLELIAQHHEERRREKVRVLLEERNQIIEDEKNGLISFSPKQGSRSKSGTSTMHSKSHHQSSMNNVGVDSTLIDRERRQLEKIKFRQEKEIKQMVDYELKMAEIKRIQEEKLEFQRQRERQREMEVQQKRQEAEEHKMRHEEEKRRIAEEEEERRRQMAAEEYRREQERANMEKERERQRKIEARRKEEEQKAKHDEFVRETEKKLREQQMLVEQKKRIMEEKDRIRQENLREQRTLQQQEAEERRMYHEEKLRQAKEKNDEIILQKKLEYEERQARNEEKRRQFERELEQKKLENRMRAQEKAEIIQSVLFENQKIEEKRKEDFYYKKAMAEERKRELDKIAEQERQTKIRQQREKDMQRRQVKENMESRLGERVGGYLQKMAESEEKVARVQKEKDDYLKHKHALEIIKKADKLENVQRIARMQEYQKEKLLEKINHDTERANQIREEKQNLLNMRMGIRKEMEGSKRSLMERFDLVKKGKLNPESVSAEFSQSHSLSQGPRFKANSQRSAEGQGSNYQSREIQSAEQFRHSGGKGKPKKQQTNAKKAIENLKIKQNHEMLALLEEEQNRENERELKLQSITDPREKEKLEKSFALERAKAHSRIQQLADSHDEAIRQLMSKYNLKNLY